MKPSLAIEMSGHMRSFEITHPSFNKLLENLKIKYECSLFIHTWNRSDSESQTYYDRPPTFSTKEISGDIIENIYSPESYTIEEQKPRPDRIVLHRQSLSGLYYSEYSKYMANRLKINSGKKFDYTICLRPDLHFYNTSIEIKGDKLWMGSVKHSGGATDAVCLSSSDIIDKARQYFLEYEHYLSTYTLGNNECYFIQYLLNNNIPYELTNYYMPYDWKIVRSWWKTVDDYEFNRATWDRRYYDK